MESPVEYAAVRHLLQQYIEGSYTANVDLLKTCFHAEATMSGYLQAELDIGTPQPFYDELEAATSSREAGENYLGEIGFIDICGPWLAPQSSKPIFLVSIMLITFIC